MHLCYNKRGDKMKFEYKIIPIRLYGVTAKGLSMKDEQSFNELGKDGWELVTIQAGINARQLTAVFKRVIRDE